MEWRLPSLTREASSEQAVGASGVIKKEVIKRRSSKSSIVSDQKPEVTVPPRTHYTDI